jgi:transcriptional regulator with XRE-family HTH domain
MWLIVPVMTQDLQSIVTGDTLKMLRAEIGKAERGKTLTQPEFAQRIGVKRSTLSMWELNNRKLSQAVVAQIAQALNTRVEDLYRSNPSRRRWVDRIADLDVQEQALVRRFIISLLERKEKGRSEFLASLKSEESSHGGDFAKRTYKLESRPLEVENKEKPRITAGKTRRRG